MTLSFHPYANLFPLIEGQEFYDLAEDIRVNGMRDPIDLVQVGDEYQILDGRNRYRALVWLASTGEVLGGVDAWGAWHDEPLPPEKVANPRDRGLYSVYGGPADGEALAYVLSKNLKRRHLDESQRAMVAARLGRLKHGGDRSKPSIEGLPVDRRAEMLNVGRASVERAQVVQERAAPEIAEAVDRGEIAVSAAAEIASQPVERQAEIAKSLTRDASGKLTDEAKKALAPLIREIRADKIAAKKERRAEREQEFGRRVQSLPGSFYGVAIEDFEWHHAAWSEETGSEKSPSMHYETALDAQTPEAIVARCAERFACLAPDCVLFKWVTIPHLAIGLKVLELQGFEYVSSMVWNKERAGAARGPGYWVTGEHEIVLIGKRGNVVAPATAHFRSNFSAPVGAHSEKPDNLHEIIEFHWPNTPKVEFNARRRRPGWAAWGFDAPDDHNSQANAGDVPAAEGGTEGVKAPVSRVADGRTSDEGALCGHGAPSGFAAGEGDLAATPAPPEEGNPLPAGTVVSDVAAELPAACIGDAALPANRPGASHNTGDVTIIDQLAGADWLAPAASEPPFDPASLPEREALKILSDFCHVRRDIAPALGEFYHARGFAYRGAVEWSLTGKGWDRLRELEAAELPPRLELTAPNPVAGTLFDFARQLDLAPAPQVVDGALQTRLPVDDDELAEQLALIAVQAGEPIDGAMARHLVGKDFLFATTTQLIITERGTAFLAQLVSPAVAQQQGAAS